MSTDHAVDDTLPTDLDIAVLGSGAPILAELAAALIDLAGDATWAIFNAGPIPDVVPPEARIPHAVSTAFSMGDHVLLTSGDHTVRARTLIVQTAPAVAAIPGERALRGRGVSYCASCDGTLSRGRRVAVLVESADLLPELDHLNGSEHIYLLGDQALVDLAPEAGNLTAIAARVVRVDGDRVVSAVGLDDGTTVPVSALFMLTHQVPPDVLVPGVVADTEDRIVVDHATSSTIAGVFAIGPGTISSDPAHGDHDGTPRRAVHSALTIVHTTERGRSAPRPRPSVSLTGRGYSGQ